MDKAGTMRRDDFLRFRRRIYAIELIMVVYAGYDWCLWCNAIGKK